MRDFTTEFQNFIDDILNDVIINLKENNPEYAKCKCISKKMILRLER